VVKEITNYLCEYCDSGYDTRKEAEICEKECIILRTTIKDESKSDLKKELPELTKIQKEIIDFWNTRGYENITHTLGMNIRLHLKDKYVPNGLDLIYLEQFYNLAKKDIQKDKYQCEKCKGTTFKIKKNDDEHKMDYICSNCGIVCVEYYY